jgi:ACT domain-containing protein
MKAIISVIGKDTVGILAKVTVACAETNVNVTDVSQTVMHNMFAMTMLADVSECSIPFGEFSDKLKKLGGDMGLQIHVMHEDIFNSMHKV